MLKKLTKLACLSFVALSASLTADTNTEMSEIYSGGFTLGTSVNTSLGGVDPFLTFGYIDDFFLVDVGFNFKNLDLNSNKYNYAQFMGHLGLRNQVYKNLYVTYGATGGVVAGKTVNGGTPYNVGAFLGLDLQATRHFLISAKVNPYLFQHAGTNVNFNEVFASGSVNFSYVF